MSVNMNSTSKIADSTRFHSGPLLAISSTLTSPPNLLGYAVAGGATLLGASLPVTTAIGTGAALLAICMDTFIIGGNSLRPAVFLGAEELSFFIEGGRHSLIVPPVLECVKK